MLIRFLIKFGAVLTGLLVTLVATIVASGFAAYYYLQPGLPAANTLKDVPLQLPLKIYSRDGRLMAQFGEKRRTPVDFEQIPPRVVNAFLAAEDDRFFEHPGFDIQGIVRAGYNLMATGNRSQGGSTITQQLAREYFLTRDRTFARKIKEVILAIQIEALFTKQEILSLYLNKIFLGQRAYGVVAAAEVYFGKSLSQLSVAEAATIAGLPAAPSRLNPVSNPDQATDRRGYVLRRMRELNFITDFEYNEALATPMLSKRHGPKIDLEAPYVAELVRQQMLDRFGAAAQTDGYTVMTTIDSKLQVAADQALRTALLEYDRRHGYRGPIGEVSLEDVVNYEGDTRSAMEEALSKYPYYTDLYIGLVVSLEDDNSANIYIRGEGQQNVPWENLRWRRWVSDNAVGQAQRTVDELLKPGEVIFMLNTDKGWRLGQLPAAQGALVSLDPYDGGTAAMAGGFDFAASKFNRAVQASRQPGSSFKPFIYSAALENGYTAASIVNDAPIVYDDPSFETPWRPENYSRKFYGPTRLREGLVKSLNLVTVRVVLTMGVDRVISHLSPFGFSKTALPDGPSLSLGSGGIAPWDLADGYSTFANGGYNIERYIIERIEDANGEAVFQADPVVACRECADHWYDGREKNPDPLDLLLKGSSTEQELAMNAPPVDPDRPEREAIRAEADFVTYAIEDPIQTEPEPTNEVPGYYDMDEMIAEAGDWRPTAEETPQFWADVNSADRVISVQNSWIVYDMMRDVIKRGTGRRALELKRSDLAGKTGTSNDRRDAWFAGFNADMVAIAWVGFDQERSLGRREEGSRTALPMWKYFMAEALEGTSEAPLPQPPGLVRVRISPATGRVAAAGDSSAMFEIFREGQVPELRTEGLSSGSGDVYSGGVEITEDDIF